MRLDVALYVNATAMLYFGFCHVFRPDGSLPDMGYSFSTFMPSQSRRSSSSGHPFPVPEEISLLLTHMAAAMGAAQLSLAFMCLQASFSEATRAKKNAARTMTAYLLLLIFLDYTHPAGTGEDGSPRVGFLGRKIAGALVTFTIGAVLTS